MRWAYASQSVPYAMNGYLVAVTVMPVVTCAIHDVNHGMCATNGVCGLRSTDDSHRTSCVNGNAVTPATTRPTIMMTIQTRMRRTSISRESFTRGSVLGGWKPRRGV